MASETVDLSHGNERKPPPFDFPSGGRRGPRFVAVRACKASLGALDALWTYSFIVLL